MSIYAKVTEDSVFNEGTILDDSLSLKDPKPFREAFVVTELAQRIPPSKMKEFSKSSHARALIEADIISPDAMENLVKGAYNDRSTELMVCHMAQEVGDDRWDELVRLRSEERQLLNSMMADYMEQGKEMCDKYCFDFVNRYVPKEY